MNEAVAKKIRQVLRSFHGLRVEAVSWIHRSEDLEFAAIVVHSKYDEDRALEFLTDPRCNFRVTRQTATRIFIAAA